MKRSNNRSLFQEMRGLCFIDEKFDLLKHVFRGP